ncbi:MAG TPA: pirin family protein [Dermatophilaceae bacterium]|nr:pirin family protein [Dermatophilaceae bacterium]
MTETARPAPLTVIEPRDVPLGGPRSMTVRRTLPSRERSFVGAWCFVDHYGPDHVAGTGGMDVAPHPHCGLATVSWLFRGEVEHRDSLGTHAVVRPGEVNLMTAGRGIAHSEVSRPGTDVLHGVQLWVVLPGAAAEVEPRFEHHVPEVVEPAAGVRARVFVGSLFGSTSPVTVESPLLGAEVTLDAGASVEVEVPDGLELAVLVDAGPVLVDGHPVEAARLALVAEGSDGVSALEAPDPASDGSPSSRSLRLAAGPSPARVILLGGTPFGEEVVMWWNFIGRSHEEVAAARDAWEAGSERFGTVEEYAGPVTRLPAPALPQVRLKPRGNRAARRDPGPEAAGSAAAPADSAAGPDAPSASGFAGAEAPACS